MNFQGDATFSYFLDPYQLLAFFLCLKIQQARRVSGARHENLNFSATSYKLSVNCPNFLKIYIRFSHKVLCGLERILKI